MKKLILEYNEFITRPPNDVTSQGYDGISTIDKGISINPFDRHVRDLEYTMNKLSNINKSMFGSSVYKDLRNKMLLEKQNITKLTILRIYKIQGSIYNVYISFVIDDYEYFGVIKDILSRTCTLESEVFSDFELIQTKEWRIKISGNIIKLIKNWLFAKPSKYESMKDGIECYNIIDGKLYTINKGDIIQVHNNDDDDSILIEVLSDFFILKGDNFIYFNYWFKKIKKEE